MRVYRETLTSWIFLKGHLNMFANTTMKHSTLTLTDVLKKATYVTGRHYPRSRKGAKGAYLDLREKIQDATPIERESI